MGQSVRQYDSALMAAIILQGTIKEIIATYRNSTKAQLIWSGCILITFVIQASTLWNYWLIYRSRDKATINAIIILNYLISFFSKNGEKWLGETAGALLSPNRPTSSVSVRVLSPMLGWLDNMAQLPPDARCHGTFYPTNILSCQVK